MGRRSEQCTVKEEKTKFLADNYENLLLGFRKICYFVSMQLYNTVSGHVNYYFYSSKLTFRIFIIEI